MDIGPDLAPSGTLHASINLGNPVLAQGTPDEPAGVTVDIARELGVRLGLPVSFTCCGAARESFQAMTAGKVDICFLAIDPARAEMLAFTAPYAVIEGVFAVPDSSAIVSTAGVDRPGVRIGVKEGSAYDLYLSRSLEHGELVRAPTSPDVTDSFMRSHADVAAGVRQQLEADAQRWPGLRVLDGRFMVIEQAMGLPKVRGPAAAAYLRAFVETAKADGFVASSLARHRIAGARVAPATRRP